MPQKLMCALLYKYLHNQTKPKMKTKRVRRSSHTRRRATRRNYKKGGMIRRVIGRVLGKGFERADKIKDMAKAIEDGLTHQTPEKSKQMSSLPQYFSASPSYPSPFHTVSETPRRKFHNVSDVNDNFKTPHKREQDHDVNEGPPKLGARVHRRETPEERRRRLGFSVAPSLVNRTSVVGELFP